MGLQRRGPARGTTPTKMTHHVDLAGLYRKPIGNLAPTITAVMGALESSWERRWVASEVRRSPSQLGCPGTH